MGEVITRTFQEWNDSQKRGNGWYVIDPDGFDRANWDEDRLYTWQEFYERAMKSTLMIPYDENFN